MKDPFLKVKSPTDASKPAIENMENTMSYYMHKLSPQFVFKLAIPCMVTVAVSLTTEWPSSLSATH